MLGHRIAENFLEHVGPENRKPEGDDLPLNVALRHGKELDVRATSRHKDGRPVKVYVRSIPLRDEFGKLLGAAEFFEPAEPLFGGDERKNILAIRSCIRKKDNPLEPAYRRISLIIQYLNKPQPANEDSQGGQTSAPENSTGHADAPPKHH